MLKSISKSILSYFDSQNCLSTAKNSDSPKRSRKNGRGRKKLSETDSTLIQDLEKLIESEPLLADKFRGHFRAMKIRDDGYFYWRSPNYPIIFISDRYWLCWWATSS